MQSGEPVRIGLFVGREWSFPPAFLDEVNRRAPETRVTAEYMKIGGTTIPAGDQVLLLYGSANHDETVFPNPGVLDLERPVKSHWTFGHGIHFCLGNAVARLETRVALEVLLECAPDYAVDSKGIVRNQLVPTRGVAHAPLEFGPVRPVAASCARKN